MTCPNCSANNEDKAKSCIECGTKFPDTGEVDIQQTSEEQDIKEKLEAYTAVTTDFASVKLENEESAKEESDVENSRVSLEDTQELQEDDDRIQVAEESENSDEVMDEEEEANEEVIPEILPNTSNKKKNILKTFIIVLVFVVAAVICFAVAFAPDDANDYSDYPLVYTKDGQLMVRPNGKKESYKLCKSGNYYPYDDTLYSSTLQYTEDGSMMFFADDLSASIYDLYYRKTRDMSPKDGKKGTRIAKNVSMFQVVPGDDAVVYLADDKLCYSNLDSENMIAKSVRYFVVTDDGEMVFYEDDENNIYICGLDDDDRPVRVDSDIQSFVTSIDDYQEMYYIKNDKLYFKEENSKAKKVDSEVVYAFELEGSVFTVKSNVKSYGFEDLFIDDISANADNLVDPETLEEPDYEDYDDKDEYARAYEAYKEEYLKLKEDWQDMDKKEEIRIAFTETPFEITTYELYMLKENKPVKIADNLMTPTVEISGDYGFFKKIIPFEIEKTEISKLESAEDARTGLDDKANKALEESEFCVLARSGKNYSAFTTHQIVSDITVSKNGRYVYMLMGDSAEVDGDLVRYNLSSSALTKRKLVMEKVDSYSYYNDKFLTTINDDREFMAISSDKVTSISESNIDSMYYVDGTLYFLEDYRNNSGKLTSYKNGQKKTLVNDVSAFRTFDKNRIAYISEYNAKKDYGSLYTCNKNGKSKLVDKKVKSIF